MKAGRSIGMPPANAPYTFCEFMEDSLHNLAWGYYSDGRVLFGESAETADFTTFPVSMRPLFGALLAERLYTLWRECCAAGTSPDAPFILLELGAGLGMLAHDVLQHCRATRPDLYAVATYVIGERSRSLRAIQETTNAEFVNEGRLAVREVDAQALANGELRKDLFEMLGGMLPPSHHVCLNVPAMVAGKALPFSSRSRITAWRFI